LGELSSQQTQTDAPVTATEPMALDAEGFEASKQGPNYFASIPAH
jgi:hypothetical protein